MNIPAPPSAVTDDELNALLDGQLTSASRAAIEARLAKDPSAAATLAAMRAQRDALHSLHRAVLNQPVPPSLTAAALRLADIRSRRQGWWRWGGMAASLIMTFGAGWLGHVQWSGGHAQRVAAAVQAGSHGPAFAQQAALAHAVYAPEVRHPVEVTAAQQEHLVQWLSKRVGRPLKVPDLSALGYELVGGRLLPGDAGARAQFMFQSAQGERITLYLGAVDASASSSAASETAFRFSGTEAIPSFYWVDQGFGYALAGALPRERLMPLAQAVYEQL